MKKNILFVMFSFFFFTLTAQISFYIQEIEIYNIYIHENENVIMEGAKDGPYIWVEFAIKNNSKSPIKLRPSNSNMWLNYKYKNRNYKIKVFSLGFLEKDLLELLPDQEYRDFARISLFLGTSLMKNKGDYKIELLEVLPTLRLISKKKILL